MKKKKLTPCGHMWLHCLVQGQYIYHTSRLLFQTAADQSKPEKDNTTHDVSAGLLNTSTMSKANSQSQISQF